MAESNEPEFSDNLATRAFELFRKLSKEGKLTSEEIHELVELHRNMASANLIAQFGSELRALNKTLEAQKEILDARLESQDSKYNQMRWFIAILLAAGVLNVLATLFGWGAA